MYAKIVLVGNLGGDPEMRYTPNGTPVTNFSLAVNRKFKNSDGETVERTTWFRVAAWGKLAETTNEYLTKGRLVLVEAEDIKASAFKANDGEPRASLEVTARSIKFLGGSRNGQVSEEQAEEAANLGAPVEDEIPF
jgi:single-strand DNA-binding protein